MPRSETPRNVGLFLSALGTAAIVMGTLEYLGTVRTLRRFQAIRLGLPSLVMALLMSIGGVFLSSASSLVCSEAIMPPPWRNAAVMKVGVQ